MQDILFSAYSAERFPLFVLPLVISIYLYKAPVRKSQNLLLAGYFFVAFLFHFGNFFVFSLYNPAGVAGYFLAAVAPLGLAMLVQFSYRFPTRTSRKEARWVLWVCLALALAGFFEYLVMGLQSEVTLGYVGYATAYRSRVIPPVALLFSLFTLVVFLRKLFFYEREQGGSWVSKLVQPSTFYGRTCRNFAGLVALELANIAFLTSEFLFRAIYFDTMLTVIHIAFLVIYILYIFAYLHSNNGVVPFNFKVVAATAVLVLVIINLVGRFAINQFFQSYENQNQVILQTLPPVIEDKDKYHPSISYVAKLQNNKYWQSQYSKTGSLPSNIPLYRHLGVKEKHDNEQQAFEENLQTFKRRFYTRFAKTNYYHYNTRVGETIYGIGFDYLYFRQGMHSLVGRLLLVYLGALLLLFIALPLLLMRFFSQPFSQVLSGLYNQLDEKGVAARYAGDEINMLALSIDKVGRHLERARRLEGEVSDLRQKLATIRQKDESPSQKMLLAVDKVVHYIDENFTEDISREGLAAMVDLSPGRLGKAFKKVTNLSIAEYINEKRIELSLESVKNVEKGILDIALEMGFDSLRTFNRAFHRVTGFSPTEVRKNYLESKET